MKKVLTLLLAFVMAFALSACSSSNGKFIVGITDFEPMDYKDESGNWVGFDAELATLFAESEGLDVEFTEIDWDNKVLEVDNGSVDCIWNGMTLTDEVKSAMDTSDPYLINHQIVVLPKDKASKYSTKESLKSLKFAVEKGSAGEEALKDAGVSEKNITPVDTQAKALTEVNAGTSEATVIDSLMAAAMVGEGTDNANLTTTVELTSEEYGVGFKKGSEYTEKLNKFLADKYADGTIKELAEKYKVQKALVK